MLSLKLAAVLPRHLRVCFMAEEIHIEPLRALPGKKQQRLVLAVPAPADSALPLWQPALTVLQQWLSSQPKLRFALHVELSDRLVRYQHLPWRPGLSSREYLAYAGHRYQEVFGEIASQWHITLSDAVPGQACLACAIDKTLLLALKNVGGTRVQLLSLQTALVAAYQRQRAHLKAPDFAFAHIEAERICLLWMSQGQPRAVRNEASSGRLSGLTKDAWPHALADMSRRVRMGLGVEEQAVVPLYVCGDTHAVAIPAELGQHKLHVLETAR